MDNVAVLFFGQIRLTTTRNYNLESLQRYFKLNEGVRFDVFMHLWYAQEEKYDHSSWAENYLRSDIPDDEIYNYLIKNYKPKKCLIEKQRKFKPENYIHPETLKCNYSSPRDLGNAISQIYSISKVCSLSKFLKYDKFILLRIDCELFGQVPLIKDLQPDCFYYSHDLFQMFGRRILDIYSTQFLNLSKIPYIGNHINAEILRNYNIFGIREIHLGYVCLNIRSCGSTVLICDVDRCALALSTAGVYARANQDKSYTCRFRQKTSPKDFQWFGTFLPDATSKISYKIKFTKGTIPFNSGNKTHCPDLIDGKWLKGMKLGEWKGVERKIKGPECNPFLFIILDDHLNDEDLELEISDILIV